MEIERSAARVVGRVVLFAATLLIALLAGAPTAGAATETTATETTAPVTAPATVAGPVTQAAPNGCGSTYTWWLVPDKFRQYDEWSGRLVGTAYFTSSCNDHDRCYTSSQSRLTCDLVFKRDLRNACAVGFRSSYYRDICYGRVNTYYNAVRLFGKGAYKGSGNPA